MGKMKITSRLRSVNPDYEERYIQWYDEKGDLVETRGLCNECDYGCAQWIRKSPDNGRTWSEWEKQYNDAEDGRRGKIPGNEYGDEILGGKPTPSLYDPKSGCYVGASSMVYLLRGHDVGYFAMCEEGEDNYRVHSYFAYKKPNGETVTRMFEFEEGGKDYDPENPRNPKFLDYNRIACDNLTILPDGDLSLILFPNMRICCKLAGVDEKAFFPSWPEYQSGMILARGHWNAEKEDYEFTYSNPIMLSDLQSSRGVMEPHLITLKNGTWMVVFRGSNWAFDKWNTRISPAAPNFKWYALSFDEGRSFSPPMPWYFDTREVVYSPASISRFFRSSKNGKLYWIGNVSEEPWTLFGNDPRFPLQICEVNEEHGYLIKDTLTVVDTIRDGQTSVELSNFFLLEDKETLNLELSMVKVNFNGKIQEEGHWYSEAWEYTIEFDD